MKFASFLIYMILFNRSKLLAVARYRLSQKIGASFLSVLPATKHKPDTKQKPASPKENKRCRRPSSHGKRKCNDGIPRRTQVQIFSLFFRPPLLVVKPEHLHWRLNLLFFTTMVFLAQYML